MAYVNLASANKLTRVSAINTALGTSGLCSVYTGAQPINPDITATGTLLVSLPLSSTAAVASLTVQSAAIVAGGSSGIAGTQTVTGTTGTGTKFTASVTVAGGAITAILSITSGGAYSVQPTSLQAEPVTGASLVGATLALNLTSQLIFNAITTTNGAATGTAGYARLTTSGGTAIVDLDCGTSGTSVVLNTTSIVASSPVSVTSCILTEA